MKRIVHVTGAVLACLGMVAACDRHGPAADEEHARTRQASPSEVPARLQNASVSESGGGSLPDFARLVKARGNAVVNVNVVGRPEPSSQQGLRGLDDPFDFFRRFGMPGPDGGADAAQPLLHGQGSGFIVSSDGYVLTNAHVVSQASAVTVKLPDRREFAAKVVGADWRSDVAVLKIQATNLPIVRPGEMTQVQPGQWVAAIGSPFGFENSVTVGVVSATARALGPQSSLVPFIQTDVAVNPGNSGGPLFNLRGEVIGINSQIYSATGGYQGLSFAIPIDVALDVQRQIVETGRVTRGKIGVAIQDVDASLASAFHLDRPRGALVSRVEPDAPAARAALAPGDVILAVNGTPIETSAELAPRIAAVKPGSDAVLDVWRNGKESSMKVRVAQLDDERERSRSAGAGSSADESQLGLAVRELTKEELNSAQTPGRVIVERVEGPAAEAGIRPGDIILAIGNRPVRSVAEVRAVTSNTSGSIAFLILRDNQQIYVPVHASSQRQRR